MSVFYACVYCNHAVQYPQRPEDPWSWSCRLLSHHVCAGSRTQQVLSAAEPFLQPLASFSLLTHLLIGSWTVSILGCSK